MDVSGFTCLAVVLIPIQLYILYWIIRLAVRGGIEDADRRKHARLVDEQRWKAIQERE